MGQTKEGAQKAAAFYFGISHEELLSRQAAGLKHCSRCKEWIRIELFGRDRSRGDGRSSICNHCKAKKSKTERPPVMPEDRKPMGPAPAPERDGDKLQARARVN